MENLTLEEIEKILSYKDRGTKTELWDYLCDYLSEEGYLDPFDDEFDDTIEEVRNIFDKLV
jgi:mannitol/fructose-specific phosphotransferase system IIA component (Ntr-type)